MHAQLDWRSREEDAWEYAAGRVFDKNKCDIDAVDNICLAAKGGRKYDHSTGTLRPAVTGKLY